MADAKSQPTKKCNVLWVVYSFLVSKGSQVMCVDPTDNSPEAEQVPASTEAPVTAGEMPTLPRGLFQEQFALKAYRPSCTQRLPSSLRGLAKHRANSELLVTHVTPHTPRKLRTRDETTGLITAHIQTRQDVSSEAPARVCTDSGSIARTPQAALFVLAKQNHVRRTRTLCASGRRLYAAV